MGNIRAESKRVMIALWAVVAIALAIPAMTLVTSQPASAAGTWELDEGGEDDELQSQSDLSSFYVDPALGAYGWRWDNASNGNNSQDVCIFVQGPSTVYAVCASYTENGPNAGTFSAKTYECAGTTFATDKCTGTNVDVSSTFPPNCSQPVHVTEAFAGDDDDDIEVICTPGGAFPKDSLIIVCSKASFGPNPDAKDCLGAAAPPPNPPGFAKVFSPDPIGVGGVSTLTFTIDNSGSAVAATDLAFTDIFPSGVVIANPTNASTTCTGGMGNAAPASASFSFSGGTVPALSSCTVEVDVTSSAAGTYVNTTGDLMSDLGNSGTATDTLTVTSMPPPPGFAKVFSPDTIGVGGVSTLTFTIDNSGSAVAATNLAFTDMFPSGVVIADPTNASTTCTGGMGNAAPASASFSFSGGTVPALSSCTVEVDVTSSAAGTYVNTTEELTSSLGNSGTAIDTLTVTATPPTGGGSGGSPATAVPSCIESSFVQSFAGAAGLAVGAQFRGADGVLYVIVTGPPTCAFNCADGFDANCDGIFGDFCPVELALNLVADVKACLEVLGVSVVRTPASPDDAVSPGSVLATTGSTTDPLFEAALALVATGAAVTAFGVRRRLKSTR